jgi:hypothetical protein
MPLLITFIGFGLAVFFAALVWKLTRQERLRSAARVAALSEAIDDATPSGAAGGIDIQPALFSQDGPATAPRGGLIKLAVGIAGSLALIVAIAMMSTSGVRVQPPAPAAAVTVKDGTLELLSMRHQRDGDALTVTGLVRNGGTAPAQRLIAVVFVFDRSGNFIASGRAPLDFLSLAPGDESPFRVSVTNAGDVERYRVSFRTESGVVRHIDRRQALVARRME